MKVSEYKGHMILDLGRCRMGAGKLKAVLENTADVVAFLAEYARADVSYFEAVVAELQRALAELRSSRKGHEA